MMQDTLVRVFVLALSLLMHPMEDPGVEERDDVTTVSMHEEKLMRGEEKSDHEMAVDKEEVTCTDNKVCQGNIKPISKGRNQSAKHDSGKDNMSLLEDATESKKDSEEHSAEDMPEWKYFNTNLNQKGPENSQGQPEVSQSGHETLREAIQTGISTVRQRHQEDPEEKGAIRSKDDAPLAHFKTKASENKTSKAASGDWEDDHFWYIWNIFSIISMIQLLRKHFLRNSQIKPGDTRPSVTCTAAEVQLPDSNTLHRLYSTCIQVSSHKRWREDDFLEGLANDLLDAMRTVCDRSGAMVIEDFRMVDACEIIVPFRPTDPYSFESLLWNNQAGDTQVYGQIKLVQSQVDSGCHCQSPDAEDVVCLLHCETENVEKKAMDVCGGLLCAENSPLLSKSQVARWFRSTIKQAWTLISHKYEFELNICYFDAPGALTVRFRSGRKIIFSMNPVVEINTDAHFFMSPYCLNSDTLWTLSLTNYEKQFLELLSKRLPENSCHTQALEIALFLHKRQTTLSGSCVLTDFHFKMALIHLLWTTNPSQWKANNLACRLRDLLKFMEESLEKKQLHHVLIGNPSTQKVIDLPAGFTQAKNINLFHPLVVHNCMYRNVMMHFQELLRSADMLIHDYVDQ